MIAQPRAQRGATLMIALIMLAVILLLGTASASLLVLDEHAARNHRAHAQALLAAQAALDDACEEVRRATRVSAAAFPAAGCRADNEGLGLCRAKAEAASWTPQQLSGAQPGAAVHGQFTGRRMPAVDDVAPPRYVIELLAGGNRETGALYRISAIGSGRGGAQAGLQGIVRRRTQDDGESQAQCRWLAWRRLSLP